MCIRKLSTNSGVDGIRADQDSDMPFAQMDPSHAYDVLHARSDGQPRFKNRSRMVIISNILELAKDGVMKTHLMYQCNLSYTMLRDYLSYLKDRGMLEEIPGNENHKGTIYRTTDRGARFQSDYKALLDCVGPIIDQKPFSEPLSRAGVAES